MVSLNGIEVNREVLCSFDERDNSKVGQVESATKMLPIFQSKEDDLYESMSGVNNFCGNDDI